MSTPNSSINTPKIPFHLLNNLEVSCDALFSVLAELMTDEMLQSIAAADYGYREVDCFNALKAIVTTKEIPQKVDFIVTECLELTRWIRPSNKQEDLCRAFSCCLLLILEVKSNYNSISDENETLAGLIESMSSLNIAQGPTQALIVWRILSDYKEEEAYYLADEEDQYATDEITINPFFIHSLLLLLVFDQAAEAEIEQVLDWSIDMEKYEKNMAPFYNKNRAKYLTVEKLNSPFLLGTTTFGQRHGIWKTLTQRLKEWSKPIVSDRIQHKLKVVIEGIVNAKPIKP